MSDLELAIKEWRAAREEWLTWESWGDTKWKEMPTAQGEIIARMGRAEGKLMEEARKL